MSADDFLGRLQDSFLSCPICFQGFIRPKALPCLHTFCEGCLREYVASRFESTGQFPCPLCRQIIFIPAGGVANFHDNHFIVGLSDTVEQFGNVNPSNVQNETSPLLPSTNVDHFKEENVNKLIRHFGEYGSLHYQFIQPSGIAVSMYTDDVFISDTVLNRICVYSSLGQFRRSFQCDCSIRGITCTRAGTILVEVSTSGNAILRQYSVEGQLLGSYGSFYSHERPFGVALTSTQQAVVSGLRQNCVHVLTYQFKPSIRFGSRGRGQMHFTSPYFLTVNNRDQVIVSDCGNNRVKTHALDGAFVSAFGHQGSKKGELFYPMGVCVDRFDNIYIADANNYRVQIFSPDGESLSIPVKDTYNYGIDVKPVNVALIQDNMLLVVLRGSKFCQINAYRCDINRFKPIERRSWINTWCCCR